MTHTNPPPSGGDQKALVNVKDTLCSLMMGSPTDEWGELPSPGLMLCQTSTQDARKNQSINNSVRKGDARIMHVGNTILDAPYGKYLCVHCNNGVTYTNKIGDLSVYYDPIWYNPKVIANILSLGLVQKNHPVTYNSRDGNEFVIHSPQRPTF